MKTKTQILALFTIFALLLGTACKEDGPDPGPEPVPGAALAGTWVATQDNAITGPAADQFENFSITINPTTDRANFTTTNGGDPLVFPTSGHFVVEASDNFENGADVIRQPDNVTVNIDLNGDVMTMRFNINVNVASINSTNSRVASINGDYTFVLNKQ